MRGLFFGMLLVLCSAMFFVSPVLASPDVRLGHVATRPGTVVQVPLTLAKSDAARAVFTIHYDPVFLEPVKISDNPAQYHLAGKDSQGEIISSSRADATVQVVVENPGGLLSEGELVLLPFTLNRQTAAGSTIPLSVTATYQDGAENDIFAGILASGSVTAQDSVMVAVRALLLAKPHVPIVSAGGTPTAYPPVIVPGGTAVLTWGFLYADTVTIDNGIGEVPLSGMLAVSPAVTTTYHITATSEAGTITLEVTVTVDQNNPLTIQITSPSAGASIARPDTMVQGTITNSADTETGVTVNGMVALKENNNFTANHVPLKPGSNIITATVTDSAGHTTGTSIIVQADPTGNYIELSTDTITGIAPLEFTISVDASFTLPAIGATLTHTGPGTIEVLSSTPDTFDIRLTTPGIYYFTATVTYQGNTYTDVIAVQVLDKAAVEQSLKAKWNAMKAAMVASNVDTAVHSFVYEKRQKYQRLYSYLLPRLPNIANTMEPITFLKSQGSIINFRIYSDEVWGGQTYTLPYEVIFMIDVDGIWRIYDY
jgi:hypothetical protein